jgi:hypothetical protein
MAKGKQPARKRAAVQVGDRLIEGVVVEVREDTVLLGRPESGPEDAELPGEDTFTIGGRRVFLARGQGFLPLAGLSGR